MATPRQPLDVSLSLDRILCIDEGDGPGNAEPYLWTLFFKIDGDTAQLVGLNLKGIATVERRNGAHDNLIAGLALPPNPFGRWHLSVDAGDVIDIAPALGRWETSLKPIPLAEPLDIRDSRGNITDTIYDIPAYIGVVCVLMEEDNVSDSAAIAGYNAFCSTFETKLNEKINTLGLSNQDLTDEDQQTINDAVQEAVESAIVDDLNVWEKIGNWVAGSDQKLGTTVFKYTLDTLNTERQIFFEDHWHEGVSVNWGDIFLKGPGNVIQSGGEWKIFGHISATPTPQLIGTFGPIITFSQEDMAIRDFRQRAEVAEQAGFVGAFPNFHTAQYGRNNVGGTIFLKPGCAVRRDILLSELGNPSLDDFAAMFRAAHVYATNQAFVGGFPNFFHAEETVFSQSAGSVFTDPVKYGEENKVENPALAKIIKTPKSFGGKANLGTGLNKVTVCGTVLIKPGCAEFRDISLAELGNPLLSDIGARFRGTQDYAIQHGFVGGFPTFFHADYGNGIVCGTILLTQAAAEWRDVLLWLGPA